MPLPIPDHDALLHSEKLIEHIRLAINESNGSISFAQFMEVALYTPGLGYYSAGAHKIGKGGDFTTAPEISPLFAQCIARQCQQVLSSLGAGDILEVGAGSGAFAKDILTELEEIGTLPTHYFILEVSADLRARQKEFLSDNCPHYLNRIVWLDHLPAQLSGIIFANEVMDAMPVNCFLIDDEGIKERQVTWEQNKFTWYNAPARDELKNRLNDLTLPTRYESEVNLRLPGWIHSLSEALTKGVILLIDYGYGRNEYYHPDRMEGTLMCFYQQHKHSDPFKYVGLQDITAHVDFTNVIESAYEADLSLGGYTTQAGFLLSCGLLDLATQNTHANKERLQQNQAIKILTLPSQMGEIVKVMALVKNFKTPLLGFGLYNRERDL